MHEPGALNPQQQGILDRLNMLNPLTRSVLGVDAYEKAVREGVRQDTAYSLLKQRISLDELKASHISDAFFNGGFIRFKGYIDSSVITECPYPEWITRGLDYYRCDFLFNRPTPLFPFENYLILDRIWKEDEYYFKEIKTVEKIVADITEGNPVGERQQFEKHPFPGSEHNRVIALKNGLTQKEFADLAEKFMEKFSCVKVSAAYEKVPGHLISEFGGNAQPNPFGYL